MATYQNIFTQVQVRGPAYPGMALPRGSWQRDGKPGFSHLLGVIGSAQLGPIYLGWAGIMSLIFGFAAFEIIGLNMFASVHWDPVQFVRQLPWLGLEPPPPAYGLHLPPLQEGGWWLIAGFCLTTSVLALVGSHVPASRAGASAWGRTSRGPLLRLFGCTWCSVSFVQC